jgi:CDP-glucose 4,6-dehydratase
MSIGGVNADFWRGRRVLVTGHTGFKGSWLSLWLQQLGAKVVGYALAPQGEQPLFNALQLAGGMAHHVGDIRDQAALQDVMQTHQVEVVLHLAAQALVRPSYQDPIETYEVNVMGSLKVMEAVRRSPSVRAVVMVTTDKCYANREWCWAYRETDALGGHDPYSASKGAMELVVDSHRNAFFAPDRHAEHGVAMATVRAGNVIGGGDWSPDRLLPDLMRAFRAGQGALIRNARAVRP